jgi:hypothetical protein
MKPSSSAFKILYSWYEFFIFCSSCWAVDGLLLGFFYFVIVKYCSVSEEHENVEPLNNPEIQKETILI